MVVDVLTDEASIDRGVKPLLFVGDILDEIAMSGIGEIERIGRDKFLGNVVKALPRDLVLLTAIASWFLRSALLQQPAPYEEWKDLRQPLVMAARVARRKRARHVPKSQACRDWSRQGAPARRPPRS